MLFDSWQLGVVIVNMLKFSEVADLRPKLATSKNLGMSTFTTSSCQKSNNAPSNIAIHPPLVRMHPPYFSVIILFHIIELLWIIAVHEAVIQIEHQCVSLSLAIQVEYAWVIEIW